MRSAVLFGIIATIVAIGAGLGIYYGFKPSDDKETSPSLSPTKSPTTKKWTVIGDLSEFDNIVMAKNGETVLGYKGDSHQFLDWQSNEWVKRGQAVGGFLGKANILDDGSAAIIVRLDYDFYCHFTANNCNSFDYSNYSENGFYELLGLEQFFLGSFPLTEFFEDKYFKLVDSKLTTFSLINHTLTLFNPAPDLKPDDNVLAMSLNPMKIAVIFADGLVPTKEILMNVQLLNEDQWVNEKENITITNHYVGIDFQPVLTRAFAFSKDGTRLAHWSSLLENDFRVKVLDENYDQLGKDIRKEGVIPYKIELSDDGAVLLVHWYKSLSEQQVQRYTWAGTSWQPDDPIDIFADVFPEIRLSSDDSRLLIDSHSYNTTKVPAKVYELM